MFQFFKRKGGKDTHSVGETSNESAPGTKDVVNLLIPETNYQKPPKTTTVSSLFQIMAGKKKRGRKKRYDSIKSQKVCDAERAPDVTIDENKPNEVDPAECIRALVLQKYAKSPHVPAFEPNIDEKRRTEALLRQIAKSIDCTVDKINDEMGGTDSKLDHVYQSIDSGSNSTIDSYKNNLKEELNRLDRDAESPSSAKKSNLKPPRIDDGCSDDDRSDSGKKKVTFRKHIVFDDGDQQTDDENDSFESLSSEEEEEYLEDDVNKTVISINEPITIKINDGAYEEGIDKENRTFEEKRIFSDNSDSGYLECLGSGDEATNVKSELESESDSETEEEIIEEIVEEIIEEEISGEEYEEEEVEEEESKSLVNHEERFQSQVDSRSSEAERTRELVAHCRKEVETKDREIEQLKCDLTSAYKESEMVRQRGRSLEQDLAAARSCSAGLAEQLQRRQEESMRELRTQLEDAEARRASLEARILSLEREIERLGAEKKSSEQRAQEALTAAEASTAKWRSAHEAARSQAAARAERMLADCEWKMRELEKRARDAEGRNKQLTETVQKLESSPPTPAHVAELQQLRGLVTEQQRNVQALTLQLQKLETREEALKLEVHRLKELLRREEESGKEKEHAYAEKIKALEETHSKTIETLRSEHASTLSATRSALELSAAARSRTALSQLRSECDQSTRNSERKLRELNTRYETLKEELVSKETQYEASIAEARSKADWDILQLRHLLDKADIEYANKIDKLSQSYEAEKEELINEWAEKLREAEEKAETDADEAQELLEATRLRMMAEKMDQLNKLKEQHRKEMDEQWEQFMSDKESCLERMKTECRQEGDEERVKREKELLEEIAELKSQVHSKSLDFDNLAVKAAACGRTLSVTEQELREALERERVMRERRSEDGARIKQLERSSKEQVEHLTRKCACLRKLFDDIRARLNAKERAAELDHRAKDKEIHQLRGEVARLTKLLVAENAAGLGARTSADGCEVSDEGKAPRKGSQVVRKRTCPLPELTVEKQNGRPRAHSVDLPAVQVPVRIKQLEGKHV